jgi:hypothetical protein
MSAAEKFFLYFLVGDWVGTGLRLLQVEWPW